MSIANGDANTEYVLKLTEGGTSEFVAVTTDENGAVSTTVNVSDNLAADSSVEISIVGRTETASVDLIAVNDAPALTGDAAAQGAGTEDTAFTVSAEALLTGYTDEENDALSVANVAADNGATVADNGDGTYTITPVADFNGVVTVSYDVTDGAESVAASWELDFAAVNDAPVAEDAAFAVAEAGEVQTGQLVASDVDAGDELTFALDAPVEGLTLNPDGSWTFDPSLNTAAQALTYTDADLEIVANYTVTDSEGATDSKSVTITVTPTPLTFTLESTVDTVEEGSEVGYTLVASEAVQEEFTGNIQIELADGDTASLNDFGSGSFNPQPVTIAQGETTSNTVTITPTNDATTETPETFTATATVDGYDIESIQTTVQDPSSVGGLGQTFTLTTGVDTIPGLLGSAGTTGTDGNDTIVGVLDNTTTTNQTLSALDSIDGGLGNDTLRISDLGASSALPGGLVVSNVESVVINGSNDITLDSSNWTGVTSLTSTVSAGATLEAADSTDISVSGSTGAVVVDGGKDVTVTDSTANQNITVGDTTESAGTVTVTDTNQGTGVITVEGGTDVTVTATVAGTTADVTGGAINVGNNTDQPTGAITVTQNNTNTGVSTGLGGGTPAVLAFDLAGLVLDDTDTLQFANAGTLYTSTADNTAAAAVATALNGQTIAVNGVTYDITAAGTVVTFTGQTNSANNVSTDFGALSASDNGAASNFSDATSYIQTTDTDGTADSAQFADVNAGAINVQGGTSIDITVNSTSTAADETADGDITNGTVTATAGDDTTTISVVQNNTANTQTEAATDLVGGTATVTFKALASGESVTVAGLTFTAAQALEAEDVAQAFADLTAIDTQSNGGTANGVYTDDVDANITSGAANGAVVVFTNTAGTAAPTLNLASSAGATSLPTAVTATGTAATAVDTSANTVTAGNVVLNDNATASVTDITVTNFGTATLGTTNGFDVLETLNLTNSGGAITLDTAATSLTVNANDVDHALNIDSGTATVETLTINATDSESTSAITAAAVTDLTVKGDSTLTATGSTFTALTTLTVSESASFVLAGTNEADTLESVDASGSTGAVTVGIDGSQATYNGSAGVDTVTLSADTIDKSIELNDGNDTLILNGDSTTVPTSTVDGGNGTDTISMTRVSAAGLDNSTNFATAISGFERLTISNDLNNDTIDLENLGFAAYVTLSGTETAASTLSNVANGATVVLGDVDAALTIAVKDANTVADDSVNLVNNSATNTADVVIEDVSTVNIDSTVDSADLDLDATATTTVNVEGEGSIDLDAVTMTNLTKVDASAMTDVLTFVADGAAAGTTVLGGSAADIITTFGNGDVIVGNGGADQITVADGDNLKVIGGEGADVFTIAGSSTTDSVYAIFQAAEGDTTSLGVTDGDQFIFDDGTAATTFVSQQIELSLGATESTQAYINKALQDLGEDEMGWFQYNGNTFIVREGGNTADPYDSTDGDQVIMIVGEIDLGTNASYNSTNNILEIFL